MRCVVLPSIPTSAFISVKETTIKIRQATLEDIVDVTKNCNVIINYIRHPPTIKVLSEILRATNFITGTEYRLYPDDVIIVVGLKFRAPVSGQDVNVTPDDLLVLIAEVQYIVIT
jgi:hypothetical protein